MLTFFLMILLPPRSTLFPYTTLFRSIEVGRLHADRIAGEVGARRRRRVVEVGNQLVGLIVDRRVEEDVHGLAVGDRSEEHTSELQSRQYLVCRLLLEKKISPFYFNSR